MIRSQSLNGNSVPELVEGRRFIFRLGFRSGFTHTKTTKCELASLKQHILLNVFAHINLFPTSTKCRQIESPKRLNASVGTHGSCVRGSESHNSYSPHQITIHTIVSFYASESIILSNSAGVTTIEDEGKCFVLPVVRNVSSLDKATS